MRKILLAFFISIFFLSGLFGFGVVRQVRAIAEAEVSTMTPATQINLILVHVDDLNYDRPGLTSIWGVFISRSVVPGLIMKRIYPEAGSPASAKLAAAFSMDQQKQLDHKFLAVMKDLDLPAAEIVLVDGDGLTEVAAALTHHVSQDNLNREPGVNQENDLHVFQDVCTAIDTPSGMVPFVSVEIPLLNTMAKVDSAFDYLSKWKGLVTSLHFASCEVLAGP